MDYETGLDVSAHPYRKDEWHHGGGDKNGRQKGALSKQVERWKNDGEDKQLRQEPSDQDAPPPQLCGFHTQNLATGHYPLPTAPPLVLPFLRSFAHRFFWAAAIAARPAAEMPLRLPEPFGRLRPRVGESFFFLRSAEYFFILTLTERRSAAVIYLRPGPGTIL